MKFKTRLKKIKKFLFRKSKAFSLIELLMVIAIISILSTIIFSKVQRAKEMAYKVKARAELNSVKGSLDLYLDTYGEYPPDTNRDVPPGLEEFLEPGLWPDAAWPGSVFDWENWDDPITGEKIYQISIRFCPMGQPDQCNFPNEDWAENFDINSSVYYCISGSCRAHISKPVDHPGYCVNCN